MKLKLLLVVASMSGLLMTGCDSSRNLTENETNIIAEYVAGVVLKHDKNYKEALILPEIVSEDEKTQTVTSTPTPTPGSNNTQPGANANNQIGNTQANADFTEVIGIKGLTVEYSGYKTMDDLSDSYFTIESGSGYQLLVAKFNVKNTTKKEIDIELGSTNIVYQIDINQGIFQKPLLTFLDNDLRLIDSTVKAKDTLETVLVFKVKDDIDLDTVNVIISRGDKTAIVKLK